MENHVIVCGFGIVGRKVSEVLKSHNIDFVVIELDPDLKPIIEELKYDVIVGDATSARSLRNAGINRAKAVVAAIDNDAKNLFIVLAAKQLNNKIFIAARTKDETITQKFQEAGANYIVNSLRSATDEIMSELVRQPV